ncbi:MAG: hypothetical protein RR272_04665 [Synergistaceae bacterium]
MNKMIRFVALAFIIVVLIQTQAIAKMSDGLAALLNERQTNIWVEGEFLGDFILGSRGRIEFIYLDEKLSRAIAEEHTLAQWVDELNQYFGSPATEKKALFLVQLEVNKPWSFNVSDLVIGDYKPKKEDIISLSWRNPDETLQSETKWQFAFVVPESIVYKNKSIKLGYKEDVTEWKIPQK